MASLSKSQIAEFRAVIDAGNVVHYAGRSAWTHEQLDEIVGKPAADTAPADAGDKKGVGKRGKEPAKPAADTAPTDAGDAGGAPDDTAGTADDQAGGGGTDADPDAGAALTDGE
jgi:hypothetical protein